ncbi:uncharacterized protein V1513DRAFT_438989, partial [Lipomyces chichibuensis]|uniref:uncharacterized protein n=1 Tax=Lipomyces chichibuensis TaxID=1546026 RepID=UPI00334420DE
MFTCLILCTRNCRKGGGPSLRRRCIFARIRGIHTSHTTDLFRVATVITMQRALHEIAAHEYSSVSTGVREYIANYWPQVHDRIAITESTAMKSTHRKYTNSSKDPDGSFFYDDDNAGLVLQVVIEAEHSEHYATLCRAKNMWMKGMNAKTAVLICFKPISWQKNLEPGFYGPVEWRNHVWFGKLIDTFIEIWRVGMKDLVRI